MQGMGLTERKGTVGTTVFPARELRALALVIGDLFAQLLPACPDPREVREISASIAEPTLSYRVANLEREAILDALRSTKGKKAPAARLLGISRSTLYEKMHELGLSDARTLSD